MTAPPASKPRSPGMRLSRTIGRVSASTSAPTGTLTKKIHSHPAYFVRTPPKSTPAAAPLPPIAPQMPSALLRSEPSANVVMMIDSTAGDDDRRSDPLHRARRDQHADRVGKPAGQRRRGEDRHPDQEHPPPAEQVGRAPSEQQEAAERDRVRDQHPLQRGVGHVQRVLDRRQRDGDDRAVEHRHEERCADDRQRLPASWVGLVVLGRRRVSPPRRPAGGGVGCACRFGHVRIVPPRPGGRIPETRSPDRMVALRRMVASVRGGDGWSAGNASWRCSSGCSPPRGTATARCSSCTETLGSARPRCSSMRLGGRPIFACSEPRGSKGRRSSTTRRCSSCVRRSWSCPSISRTRNAQALDVAFGRSAGHAPSPFLVGLAVLSLLSDAAEQQPLFCVVDDAQWLDGATARALAFVARRLLAERIVLAFATRDAAAGFARFPQLRVDPLGRRDARALLESVLAARLDEPVLERIVAETGGNPLAILELPRGLTPAQLARRLRPAGGAAAVHWDRAELPPAAGRAPTRRAAVAAAGSG